MSRMRTKGRSSWANIVRTSSKHASRWTRSKSLCQDRGLLQTISRTRPISRAASSSASLTITLNSSIRSFTAYLTCSLNRISIRRLFKESVYQEQWPRVRINFWSYASIRRQKRAMCSVLTLMAPCQLPWTLAHCAKMLLENCRRISSGQMTFELLNKNQLYIHNCTKFSFKTFLDKIYN